MDKCSVENCLSPVDRKGYCCKHYNRQWRTGKTEPTRIMGDDALRLRHNSKVDGNGCWVWQKSKSTMYGAVVINKKYEMAHRASWKIFVGPIPSNLQVNHKCHNGLCINPEHLYLGTQKQNMKDMRDAGRENKVRGSASGMAKLTEKLVYEMKKELPHSTIVSIAQKYKVSESCVRFIKQGKTWKHV